MRQAGLAEKDSRRAYRNAGDVPEGSTYTINKDGTICKLISSDIQGLLMTTIDYRWEIYMGLLKVSIKFN